MGLYHGWKFKAEKKKLLAKVRRRDLERRAAQYPLLADLMIQEEMARQPGYYAGEADEEERELREICAKE